MASKVKDQNYITIQGWMVNKLKLSGNELIIYALIYGFSQTANQGATCSQEYIANWCSIERNTAYRILKKLEEEYGLITKDTFIKNGSTLICEYKAIDPEKIQPREKPKKKKTKEESGLQKVDGLQNVDGQQNVDGNGLQNVDKAVYKMLHNNNINNSNNIYNNQPQESYKKSKNSFNNFPQREYSEEFYREFERVLQEQAFIGTGED